MPPLSTSGRFLQLEPLTVSTADRDSGMATRGVHATRAVRPSAHDALDGWAAPEHLCAIGRTWTLGRTPYLSSATAARKLLSDHLAAAV